MRHLVIAVLAVAAGGMALIAAAQRVIDDSATLTALAPTERVDGSALEALAAIAVYRDGELIEAVPFGEPGGDFTWREDGLPSGRHCYQVTALDLDGNESDRSEVACKRILFPPRAPTLTVR